MEVIEFKTTSPFYELEENGSKPFTVRKVDPDDIRFHRLVAWDYKSELVLRSRDPATGKSFDRRIVDWFFPCRGWMLIFFARQSSE